MRHQRIYVRPTHHRDRHDHRAAIGVLVLMLSIVAQLIARHVLS